MREVFKDRLRMLGMVVGGALVAFGFISAGLDIRSANVGFRTMAELFLTVPSYIVAAQCGLRDS